MDLSLSQILIGGALAGLAGAAMMNGFMRSISVRFSQRVNMITALGSLLTGNTENANRIGTLTHAVSGALFGVIYVALLNMTSITFVPALAAMGLGIGFIHGLVVSYGLMVVVGEHHPVPQFRQVTLETGLLHLVGHVLYGLTVGLLAGLVFCVIL